MTATATYLLGDVRDTLDAIPDGSIDLVLTSPPFLALRSYLPADHPDKHREIGAEPGPAEFIDTLLALSAEWRRVLAPHGSIAIELGDTYAGSGDGSSGWHRLGDRADQPDQPPNYRKTGTIATSGTANGGDGWPQAKSLALVPEMYRIALAYGINPLTGNPSPAERRRVRNVIRWCRPNPPVGALGDKMRPATSDMVIACTSKTRYFDLDAVRTVSNADRMGEPSDGRPHMEKGVGNHSAGSAGGKWNSAGAPPLDHWWAEPDTFDNDAWLISTEAYKGSHYATWPRKLLTKPILAMCPTKVCVTCGEPSRRIVETEQHGLRVHAVADEDRTDRQDWNRERSTHVTTTTLGWSDCGHDNFRPGVVLDPFAGSGTTLAVATGHGRHAIGIDIDARNVELARERIGPMFFDTLTLAEYRAVMDAA